MHWFYSELLFSAAFKDSKNGASSWANVDIGEPADDRIIVVATSDAAGTPIGSVTVAGNAATRRVNGTHAKIWTVSIPTGSTATISVSSSSATLNAIGVYAIYGLNSEVPVDTDTGGSTATLDVNSGGFVIACYEAVNAGTPTWSGGVTRDYFATTGGSNTYSSASGIFPVAQTANIVVSQSVNSPSIAAASWGPT